MGRETEDDMHELCEAPLLGQRRKELLMSIMYKKYNKCPPLRKVNKRTEKMIINVIFCY